MHACVPSQNVALRAFVCTAQATSGRRQRKTQDDRRQLEADVRHAVSTFMHAADHATPPAPHGESPPLATLVALQVPGLVQRGAIVVDDASSNTGFLPLAEPQGQLYVVHMVWACSMNAVSRRSGHRYYLPYLHRAEKVVATRVSELLQSPVVHDERMPWQAALDDVLAKSDAPVDLSDEQLRAVQVAMDSPFSIISGGPGTGKTFTTRTIVEVRSQPGSA